jgi:hypothetical protein
MGRSAVICRALVHSTSAEKSQAGSDEFYSGAAAVFSFASGHFVEGRQIYLTLDYR